MYGFTIVLRRKNKYQKSIRKARKEDKKDEIRKRNKKPKKRKKSIRFSKFLPIIFLVCAMTVGAFLSNNDKAKTVEDKVSLNEKNINYFVLPDDDYSFYYVALVINGIEIYHENDELSDEMIAACCWSLLSDKDAKEKYECFDEKTVIPAQDVQKRFREIFGEKPEYQNRSVNINGCRFEFDGENYTIEITGMTPTFLPKLLKLESEYGKVTLTVGCLKNDEYVQDKDGNTVEPKPSKKLRFVLEENGQGFFIKSVEPIE